MRSVASLLLLALLMVGAGACCCPSVECAETCVQVIDGGCLVLEPACTQHCGAFCPEGYQLVLDAGSSCSPGTWTGGGCA
ncbi:MAG: hypothetical protein ACYDCL_06080 [Myxococcales bacterium]